MIAGMSGSLLSHDALDELWQRPDPTIVTFAADKAHRHLRSWHAGVRARLGPTATARTVFDTVAEPLLRSLGFDISVVQSGSQTVGALLTTSARPVAALIAAPWVVPLRQPVAPGRAMRSERIRSAGLSASTAAPLRAFDVERAYARRWVEFEMEVALDVERSLWCPVHAARRPRALRRRRSGGARAGARSFRAASRRRARFPPIRSPRCGAAVGLGVPAAVARSHTDSQLLDESLVVVYRLLFLLFAEARNLVPTWHPIYRDSYTIDTIVRSAARRPCADRRVGGLPGVVAVGAPRLPRRPDARAPVQRTSVLTGLCAAGGQRVPERSVVRRAVMSLTSRPSVEGRRTISYADLGVEQLGAVYEHLLDFVVSTEDPSGARMIATGRRKATGSFYTPRATHRIRGPARSGRRGSGTNARRRSLRCGSWIRRWGAARSSCPHAAIWRRPTSRR